MEQFSGININSPVNTKALSEIAEELKLLRQSVDRLSNIIVSSVTQAPDESKQIFIRPQTHTTSIIELTRTDKIPSRVGNCLVRAGFKVVEDLAFATEAELSSIRNLGRKSLTWLLEYCQENNIPIGTRSDRDAVAEIGDLVRSTDPTSPGGKRTLEVRRINKSVRSKMSFKLGSYLCCPKGAPETMLYQLGTWLSPGQLARIEVTNNEE